MSPFDFEDRIIDCALRDALAGERSDEIGARILQNVLEGRRASDDVFTNVHRAQERGKGSGTFRARLLGVLKRILKGKGHRDSPSAESPFIASTPNYSGGTPLQDDPQERVNQLENILRQVYKKLNDQHWQVYKKLNDQHRELELRVASLENANQPAAAPVPPQPPIPTAVPPQPPIPTGVPTYTGGPPVGYNSPPGYSQNPSGPTVRADSRTKRRNHPK